MDTKYGRLFTEADVVTLISYLTNDTAEGLHAPGYVEALCENVEGDGGGFTFPADEPLFLLRGQDCYAVPTIRRYATECNTGQDGESAAKEHVLAASDAASAMALWQRENPDRVKQPS